MTGAVDENYSDDAPYRMTLSLNVLNHLGINLYSNVSAVLSEVVANAYDADATRVEITINAADEIIKIGDDGIGMSRADINNRFLKVGYRRRDGGGAVTAIFNRPVMGRKGIGKLSLFSIADVVEVYSVKDGQQNALRMDLGDIKQTIGAGGEAATYCPSPIDEFPGGLEKGTLIVLRHLRKHTTNLAAGLKKRLARRFSIIGARYNFQVFIGGSEVTAEDRDYYHKVQFLWTYGSDEYNADVAGRCNNAENMEHAPPSLLESGEVTGWLATVQNPKSLKDDQGGSIDQVTLIVRGKVAHENLLGEIKESSIFKSYLFGELHANFLDYDDQDDIATSSRQGIIEDDSRYAELIEWLRGQVKLIGSRWSELRTQEGTKAALENELIREWFGTLKGDSKKKAERLFGKINQLTVGEDDQRAELFSHAVLAFEVMRHKDNLDALDDMAVDEIQTIGKIFNDIEDLESVLYHRIVVQRLKVIEKLAEHVADDVLEKVLQGHIFDHLWLLDPSWERRPTGLWKNGLQRRLKQSRIHFPTTSEMAEWISDTRGSRAPMLLWN